MYYITDKDKIISEVQKYLLLIYTNGDRTIPRVSIDGVFGEETKEAIGHFQKNRGLENTKNLNKETFEMLYAEYKEIINDSETNGFLIGELVFPLNVGMQGEDIMILNLYLQELGKEYRDIGAVDRNGYYSKKTEAAVKNLQKIFRMDITGAVDKAFYNRMILELSRIKRKRNS